jgi:hypothetical protein
MLPKIRAKSIAPLSRCANASRTKFKQGLLFVITGKGIVIVDLVCATHFARLTPLA